MIVRGEPFKRISAIAIHTVPRKIWFILPFFWTEAICLSGAACMQLGELARSFTACHCDMCQQRGAIWVAAECNDVGVSGLEYVSCYQPSEWTERGLCDVGGTHLYYRSQSADQYLVPVGLFPADQKISFTRQVFVNRNPDYYCFTGNTGGLMEAEAIEIFIDCQH